VPRLIQCSGALSPDLRSTATMNDGRSRVPVLRG